MKDLNNLNIYSNIIHLKFFNKFDYLFYSYLMINLSHFYLKLKIIIFTYKFVFIKIKNYNFKNIKYTLINLFRNFIFLELVIFFFKYLKNFKIISLYILILFFLNSFFKLFYTFIQFNYF